MDHYLVTENNNFGIVKNYLKGLSGGTYSTLLFAINESGQQAAAFPKNVTIIGSESEGSFHCYCNKIICYCYVLNRDTPRESTGR